METKEKTKWLTVAGLPRVARLLVVVTVLVLADVGLLSDALAEAVCLANLRP